VKQPYSLDDVKAMFGNHVKSEQIYNQYRGWLVNNSTRKANQKLNKLARDFPDIGGTQFY
jgi:hypothetical protein